MIFIKCGRFCWVLSNLTKLGINKGKRALKMTQISYCVRFDLTLHVYTTRVRDGNSFRYTRCIEKCSWVEKRSGCFMRGNRDTILSSGEITPRSLKCAASCQKGPVNHSENAQLPRLPKKVIFCTFGFL